VFLLEAKNGNGRACNDELLLEVLSWSNTICLQLYQKGVGVSSSTTMASIFNQGYDNSSSAMQNEVGNIFLFDA